jgi:hypothetical protein
MDQSQNTKHNEYNEHPINKLLIDSVNGLTSSWNKLTGLFSSWSSNNSTNSSKFYNPHSHSNSSSNTSSFQHSAPHIHSSHVQPLQPKTPPTNHDRDTQSQHSQHLTQNQKELPLGALRQIDLSYVNLYNEILKKNPYRILNYSKSREEIPQKRILEKDLQDPIKRLKIIKFILSDIGNVLEENEHVNSLLTFIDLIYVGLGYDQMNREELKKDLFRPNSHVQERISDSIYKMLRKCSAYPIKKK